MSRCGTLRAGSCSTAGTGRPGRDPHSSVESLCFTPDGSRLAAAVFRQSAAYVWDLKAGSRSHNWHIRNLWPLVQPWPNPVTAGWDSIIRFWVTCARRSAFAADGAVLRSMRCGLHRMAEPSGPAVLIHGAMAFSPDGLWLATGSMDGSVNVWDPFAGKSVWNVGRHQSYVYTLGLAVTDRSRAADPTASATSGICGRRLPSRS